MEPAEHTGRAIRADEDVELDSGIRAAMLELASESEHLERTISALLDKVGTLVREEAPSEPMDAILARVRPPYSPFAGDIYTQVDHLAHVRRRVANIVSRIDL